MKECFAFVAQFLLPPTPLFSVHGTVVTVTIIKTRPFFVAVIIFTPCLKCDESDYVI